MTRANNAQEINGRGNFKETGCNGQTSQLGSAVPGFVKRGGQRGQHYASRRQLQLRFAERLVRKMNVMQRSNKKKKH